MPNPQNGQIHPDNSSATADELFECVWTFCAVGALRFKGLVPRKAKFILHEFTKYSKECLSPGIEFSFNARETNSSVKRQKEESQNEGNKKTRHAKFSKKNEHLLLPYTCTYVYLRVRNVIFSEKLACFVFLISPFWDSPFYFIPDKINPKKSKQWFRPKYFVRNYY